MAFKDYIPTIAATLALPIMVATTVIKERVDYRHVDVGERIVLVDKYNPSHVVVPFGVGGIYDCFDDDNNGSLDRIVTKMGTLPPRVVGEVEYSPETNPELFEKLNPLYNSTRF